MPKSPLMILLLVFVATGHLSANETERLFNSEQRLFGREAFVPDWHRAELIDEKASRHFIEKYWPRLKGDYDLGGQPVPKSGQVNSSQDQLVVFITPYSKPVLPDYLPTQQQLNFNKISLFAAKGESEPFSLGVRNLSVVQEVSIEVSDLTKGSEIIPSRDITNRLVLPYRADSYVGRKQYRPKMRPMVMLKPPNNRWRFPANTTHNYIVDIHVPADAAAGTYLGKVTVKAGEQSRYVVDLELVVLPFSLKVNNFHAGGFGTTYNIWEGGFSGYYPEMIEMDARYGFNMAGGFFNKGKEIPFKRGSDGHLAVDQNHPKFSKFNTTMQRLKQFGMGDVLFWHWGASGKVRQFNDVLAGAGISPIHTADGKRGFAELCLAIKKAEKTHGWPEIVINPFDEALKDQSATREIIQAVPYVRKLSPETRLYMTEWRETYTRLYQSSGKTLNGKGRPRRPEYMALMTSLEKLRANFHIIGSNALSVAAREIQNQLGGEYWHYTAVTRMGPQVRFAYGFKPFIVEAEAALVWATYKGGLDGRGWTMHYVMSNLEDGRKKRNTRGPVIASPRALGAREGIDDRKYIETLRYYARKLNSLPDLDYLAKLPERLKELTSLENIGGIDNIEAVVTNAGAFQQIRIELKDKITRLVQNNETKIMGYAYRGAIR